MTKSSKYLLFLLLMPGMLFTTAFTDRDISITKNNASVIFPKYIQFQLDASSSTAIQSVTLVYGVDRLSCQPSSSRQALHFTTSKKVSLSWELEFTRSGMIPPGAVIWWQWEITDEQGVLSQIEKKSIEIQDRRFTWQSLDRNGITVQWYQGSSALGQAILRYAEKDLQRLSSLMSIQPTRKIWITVYASTEELRTALVKSNDWVGAVTLPEYSSILLGLASTELDYADYYISHELTHLVVEELTFNCMGINLPTWLSEGLAENTQGEPHQEDLDAVILSIESRNLPALNDISSRFSADGKQARLEYVQSNLVVKYLLDTYGPQKMSDLLAAFQSGLMADEAFQKVYGTDTGGIDQEWRKSLGFNNANPDPVKKLTRTPVPTLALWTAASRSTQTPSVTPEPTSTVTTTPVASPVSPTSTAPVLPAVSIKDPPKQCLGVLILPTILFLSLILRKESVS